MTGVTCQNTSNEVNTAEYMSDKYEVCDRMWHNMTESDRMWQNATEYDISWQNGHNVITNVMTKIARNSKAGMARLE